MTAMMHVQVDAPYRQPLQADSAVLHNSWWWHHAQLRVLFDVLPSHPAHCIKH